MMSRRKLQVTLLAGLLALIVFLGYLIWSSRTEALHTAGATTRGYAAVLEAQLDASLRRTDAELQQLVRGVPTAALHSPTLPAAVEELNAMLDSRMFEFPELDGLRIFSATGDLLYTTNRATTSATNISDRDHFRKARDSHQDSPIFSEVLFTRTAGKLSLAVVRALRDEQGEFRGVAVATLNFDHLLQLLQSLDVGPKGSVAIYRRDDFRQVLRWPAMPGKLNLPLPSGSPVQLALAGNARTLTTSIVSAIDATPRIYSFHALHHYPFFVSVGIAQQDALAGWWRRSLVVGVFTSLLIALLTHLLYRLWSADAERNRLAAVAECSNDAIYIRDGNGAIVYWNDGARRLYGYTSDEVLGRESSFLVPQELLEERRLNMQRLLQGGAVANYETVRLRKDGSRVDVSIGVVMVKDGSGVTVGLATMTRDITERKQAGRAQAQLAAIVTSSNDAIVGRAPDDTIVSWNAGAERMFGWREDEVLGKPFRGLLSITNGSRRGRFEKLLRGESQCPPLEDVRRRKDGSTIHVETTLSAVRDELGNILFVSCIMRDITERLKAEREIELLATRDELTGLSNRNKLKEQMSVAIARAARANTQLAVMFVDLDKFKHVNDTLGHACGDSLLRECATRLMRCVREGDIVARLGGDEFMIVLTDVADTSIVPAIADRMLESLAAPYELKGHGMQASASIGISLYPGDGEQVETLIKNADIAMYHAKELNRNNFQFYAEEMNLRILRQAQLERELRAALENQEFVLHFQPQVNVASGEIHGVESLIRWQHPSRGLLFPGDFIDTAEETGLIVDIGDWVIDNACHSIKTWRTKGMGIPYVGVNVCAMQLNERLVATVRQALVKHAIPANWLMLEITETMLMERVDEAIGILQRIRELGVRIGMDDFGTGYSSLSVLQRLPLDTLKIDRSFVNVIDEESDNTRALAIIGAIIAISKELDLGVVAEGVEKPTQLAFLRTLNCDTYQGYLYSKPLDASTLEARYAARAQSVLEDDQGRAITQTLKVTLDLPLEVAAAA